MVSVGEAPRIHQVLAEDTETRKSRQPALTKASRTNHIQTEDVERRKNGQPDFTLHNVIQVTS